MKLSAVLKAMTRRWYISIPGLVLSVALAFGAHSYVHPTYTRSASMVMMPDKSSIPKGSNPYLYIGGLASAADVLVRASSAQSVVDSVLDGYPGSTVTISRDVSTSGPVIAIDVEAPSAAATGPVVQKTLTAVTDTLQNLQAEEKLPADQRITIVPLSVDTKAVPKTKSQLMATVAAGGVGLAITLLLSSLIDGQLLARSRRNAAGSRPSGARARRGADEPVLEADAERPVAAVIDGVHARHDEKTERAAG